MLPALLLMAAAPSLPQAIRQSIDPCKAARQANDIVVCGRNREQEQRRYRLPRDPDRGFDPLGAVDSVSRERHRLLDADGAGPDLTRGSCSSVGASGATGCSIKQWREMREQKGW
ncbi:hypothetical protein [Sphingomonas sp. PR090111-T3T-6A]|uniref:hypothetical protein n=1 Tax=Sphingomonas sp. PR090111-T3T-6A TaxID=685778 RepID=UPI0003803FBA|nr:hypothetical protein [Sphingomonas sp. PR090111-T3T-6A]